MAETEPTALSLTTEDERLRVDFRWRDDRFVQELFVDSVAAGISVEGDAHDDWPSSPPLQQLSLEKINDSSVILGVGAAGRSHWSISVEVIPSVPENGVIANGVPESGVLESGVLENRGDGDPVGPAGHARGSKIKFELACRSKERPAFIGSSYQLADSIAVTVDEGASDVRDRLTVVGPEDFGLPTYRWSYQLSPNDTQPK